ncbi:hypothetical protein VTJ83DRAFT_635 [Remersonia thermophila]|uniref:DUF4149 domain-containing protein n=1 Tax=Remersonia thermophila TaxID=72144 RepID=A0ABR4DME0_9PEZI
MDSVTAYTVATFSWLTLQSLPLLLWPSLIGTLLRIDTPVLPSAQYIDVFLEKYYARSLALSQLALAGILLVFSGILPLPHIPSSTTTTTATTTTSSSSSSTTTTTTTDPTPLARAAVLVTALHHAASASYAWARYSATGGRVTGYALGSAGSGLLAVFGLWVLLFAGEAGSRVSRRTGADKTVSGWPFKNVAAEKKRR